MLKGMCFMNNQIFRRHLREFYPLITKLVCCEQVIHTSNNILNKSEVVDDNFFCCSTVCCKHLIFYVARFVPRKPNYNNHGNLHKEGNKSNPKVQTHYNKRWGLSPYKNLRRIPLWLIERIKSCDGDKREQPVSPT